MQEATLKAMEQKDVWLLRNLIGDQLNKLENAKPRNEERLKQLAKLYDLMEDCRWALKDAKMKAVITIIDPIIEVVDDIEIEVVDEIETKPR